MRDTFHAGYMEKAIANIVFERDCWDVTRWRTHGPGWGQLFWFVQERGRYSGYLVVWLYCSSPCFAAARINLSHHVLRRISNFRPLRWRSWKMARSSSK